MGTAFTAGLTIMTVGLALIVATSRIKVNVMLAEEQAWDPTYQLLLSLSESTVVIREGDHRAVLNMFDILSMVGATQQSKVVVRVGGKSITIDVNELLEKKLKRPFELIGRNQIHIVLTDMDQKKVIVEYPRRNTVDYRAWLEKENFEISRVTSARMLVPLPDGTSTATLLLQYAEVYS
jgi:hypothetical protein